MIRNRLIAFLVRVSAFALALGGICAGSGFSSGFKRMLFYTQQSNILVAGLFLYLAVRTLIDLIKRGSRGSACYCPRLQMAFTLTISFTFVVFWCLLAPFARGFSLWTFGNLAVHTITPVLAIADYIMFCEPGHLKKRDIFLCALIPLWYVLSSIALGLCGTVFYVENGVEHYFPYIFMDFYCVGGWAVLYLLIFASAFCSFAALMYCLDLKRCRAAK